MKKFKTKVGKVWLKSVIMDTGEFVFTEYKSEANTLNFHVIADGICGLLLKAGYKADDISLHLVEEEKATEEVKAEETNKGIGHKPNPLEN